MKLSLHSIYNDRYGTGTMILRFVLMMTWVANLAYSLSFWSVYVLCAMAGIVCSFDNARNRPSFAPGWMILIHICSGVFSFLVVIANLELFEPLYGLLNLVNLLTNFAAGYIMCCEVLLCVTHRLTVREHAAQDIRDRNRPVVVFFAAFAVMAVIDLAYLIFCQYPGSVSTDSIDQIKQIITGDYDNHHPYWHTFFIRMWLNLGMALFGDINAGVAVYSVWQLCLLSAAFAYAVVTLYQAGVPKGWYLGVFALLAFHPYNISFSITMWKDVVFGAAMLLFAVSFYRLLKSIGRSKVLNYVIFGLSTVGCCVWRSNGWIALLVCVPFYLIFLWKKHRKVLLVFLCCVALGWFMKNPALKMMNVPQPDFIESLSIPVQQIGRTLSEGGELTQQEYDLLSEIIDVEEIAQLYNPGSSNMLKIAVRQKNQDYLVENKGEYLKLWLNLGMRYPGEYFRGWIDQTKGYWNGGYAVGALYDDVQHNDFGIERSGNNNIIAALAAKLIWFFDGLHVMEPLRSVGLYFWILAILTIAGLVHLREELLVMLPVLLIMLTLWVATPLFCEFRYAYAQFVTLPFLAAVMLCKVNRK